MVCGAHRRAPARNGVERSVGAGRRKHNVARPDRAGARDAFLGGGLPAMAAARPRCALGFQEPVLHLLPLHGRRHRAGLDALLEPLSLRGTSEHRRPAVDDLRPRLRPVGAGRSQTVALRLRPHGLRASAGRRPRARPLRPAPRLAASGLRSGGHDLHDRRRCLRPHDACRHHHGLRPVSAGAAVDGDRARAPLLSRRDRLRRDIGADRARSQPGAAAPELHARRPARLAPRARSRRLAFRRRPPRRSRACRHDRSGPDRHPHDADDPVR